MRRDNSKVLVVDLESACWMGHPPNGQSNEIIEIGLSVLDVKSLTIEDSVSYIVKPRHSKISSFCTKLTTITQEMVDNGEDLKVVTPKIIKKYGSQRYLWASYGEYDKNQMKHYCNMHNAIYPFSDMHLNLKTFASMFYGIKEVGMEELLKNLDIPLEGTHHRGVDDSYNLAKILIEILKKGR